MVEEVKRKENSLDEQAVDQSPTEVEDLGQSIVSLDRVAELEGLVAQKDEELARLNTHLNELEQVIADRGGEIATMKQTEVELGEKVATISDSLKEAVASYKTAVVQANPEVLAELISGDTIEAINESLNQAKALVSKVRQGLEAEISLAKVPAGAPERTSPDFSGLSPREKIQQAIGKIR